MSTNTYIKHFGVLGMHWGVRKTPSTINSSPDFKRAQTLKKKKAEELSNEELRLLTSRMQLERQYKDAIKNDLAPGKKFVTDILLNVGKQALTNYLTKLVTDGLVTMSKPKQ